MTKLPTRKVFFDLVGESHRNADGTSRQNELLICEPGERLTLSPEPNNNYDPNAIAVMSLRGSCIGYLARDDAATIVPAILEGRSCTAILHELRGGFGDYPSYGARASISWDGRAAPPHVDLDETQLRARRGKIAMGGRSRDESGKLVAAPSQGCLGLLLLTASLGTLTLALIRIV